MLQYRSQYGLVQRSIFTSFHEENVVPTGADLLGSYPRSDLKHAKCLN